MKACPALQCNSITVLGCPAEEGGGGKIDMIEKGTSPHLRDWLYFVKCRDHMHGKTCSILAHAR